MTEIGTERLRAFKQNPLRQTFSLYCCFAYSALASFRMGMDVGVAHCSSPLRYI